MSAPMFTPGPWVVRHGDMVYAGELLVADCERTPHAKRPKPITREDAANATLIADAPAMLAALRALYTHCSMIHKHWGDSCNREQADRAIQAGRAILERNGVQP